MGLALGTTLEFAWRDTEPPVPDLVGRDPFGLAPTPWSGQHTVKTQASG